MVRHEEVGAGRGPRLESLLAIPCHVLDRGQGAVDHQDKVHDAVAYNNVIRSLDDAGQNPVRAWRGPIVESPIVGEKAKRGISTDMVFNIWSVDSFLHVGTVEIIVWAYAQARVDCLVCQYKEEKAMEM